MSPACLVCTARQVSSTSLEVIPRCMNLEGSPTYSSTFVRNAITSCLVVSSISRILLTLKSAFSRIILTASFGINPNSD